MIGEVTPAVDPIAIANAAGWVQAQAAMRANDLASQALQIAWVSAIVNGLVVVAAFVVPWWQIHLHEIVNRRQARQIAVGDIAVATDAYRAVQRAVAVAREVTSGSLTPTSTKAVMAAARTAAILAGLKKTAAYRVAAVATPSGATPEILSETLRFAEVAPTNFEPFFELVRGDHSNAPVECDELREMADGCLDYCIIQTLKEQELAILRSAKENKLRVPKEFRPPAPLWARLKSRLIPREK